tara:strand:+ start:2588 stop:3319 length:732 start_codon:yes stop_codon:yes gene_type:complete
LPFLLKFTLALISKTHVQSIVERNYAKMAKIILAINNPIVSAGMRTVVEQNFSDEVETVESMPQLRLAVNEHPDSIVVLGCSLAGDATVENWRRLKRRHEDIKLIVWGKRYQDVLDFQCGVQEVDGYLLESGSSQELVTAISSLRQGSVFVAAPIAEYLAKNPYGDKRRNIVEQLSDRELQVMQMIGRGVRVSEIAEHLCISSKTINTFRYRIFAKLNINSDVQLSHLALRAGLVELLEFEGV